MAAGKEAVLFDEIIQAGKSYPAATPSPDVYFLTAPATSRSPEEEERGSRK